MRIRRGEALRPGRMVNYSHMVIGALAVTSLILLVKYRNLSVQLSDENTVHIISKKALQDELMNEADRKKKLEGDLSNKSQEMKNLYAKLKTTEDELTNSVRAVQLSNEQIETLKREKTTLTEEADRLKQENESFQTHLKNSQDELADVKDQLEKTKASVGETSKTLKDAQDKQEKLLSENLKLIRQVADFQSLQGESENLRNQLQAALADAQDAKAKVSQLEGSVSKTGDAAVSKKGDAAAPLEKPASPEKDKPIPNATEKAIQVANGTAGKDKQSADNLDVYDMLDEEAKAKLKKELQENDIAAIKTSGEVIDQPDVQALDAGSKPSVITVGDYRDAGGPAEDTAAEDLKDDAEGDFPEDNEEPIKNAEGDVPEGGEGFVAAPKAFEAAGEEGMSDSFAVNGVRNLLSWKDDNSAN